MEQTSGEEIGIRISTGSPRNDEPKPPKPLCRLTKEPGNKRRAVAKGMQKTISKKHQCLLTSFLQAPFLTFEMLLPSVSKNGVRTPVTTLTMHFTLGLCSLSCFLFHFTDSFKGPDDKIYYGFVTTKRLAVFKPGHTVEVPKDERCVIRFTDFVHAMISGMVFTAIALSDHRVTDCLLPGHVKEMDEVMESFPHGWCNLQWPVLGVPYPYKSTWHWMHG